MFIFCAARSLCSPMFKAASAHWLSLTPQTAGKGREPHCRLMELEKGRCCDQMFPFAHESPISWRGYSHSWILFSNGFPSLCQLPGPQQTGQVLRQLACHAWQQRVFWAMWQRQNQCHTQHGHLHQLKHGAGPPAGKLPSDTLWAIWRLGLLFLNLFFCWWKIAIPGLLLLVKD